MPPTLRHPANKQGRGEVGVGKNFWGQNVLISTRLAEDGNWSQFLGEAFVQCDNIPLMMAGSKIQPEK